MKLGWIIGLFVLWQGLVFGVEQDYYQSLINAGNEAYQANEWDEALANYQEVLDAGLMNANIYYNIGNVHYKLGHIPEAILFYERSLKLAPGDPDVSHNLSIANKYILDVMEPLPPLFYEEWMQVFKNSFTAKGWAYIGLICFWLLTATTLVFLLTQQTAIKKFSFVFLFAFIAISGLGFLMAQYQQDSCSAQDTAIIFEASVDMHSEPSSSSTRLYVVHEGLKVSISQLVNNWYEVILPDGSKGWIKASQVQVI